jgi:hypothetical protein
VAEDRCCWADRSPDGGQGGRRKTRWDGSEEEVHPALTYVLLGGGGQEIGREWDNSWAGAAGRRWDLIVGPARGSQRSAHRKKRGQRSNGVWRRSWHPLRHSRTGRQKVRGERESVGGSESKQARARPLKGQAGFGGGASAPCGGAQIRHAPTQNNNTAQQRRSAQTKGEDKTTVRGAGRDHHTRGDWQGCAKERKRKIEKSCEGGVA